MINTAHHLIVVPGLGGSNILLRVIVNSWTRYGFTPHILDLRWEEGKKFQPKLNRIIAAIDTIPKKKDKISLVGISAGGSAVLNAFMERKEKIHRVVNICGRMHEGTNVFPSLAMASRLSPAFSQSVMLAEKYQQTLTPSTSKKICTVRGLFDELVPVSTIPVHGAENIRLFFIEHMLTIAIAMTIHFQSIATFIKKTNTDISG